MINTIRYRVGLALLSVGMRVLPDPVRRLVCHTLVYHAPGVLTDSEKAEIDAVFMNYRKRKDR